MKHTPNGLQDELDTLRAKRRTLESDEMIDAMPEPVKGWWRQQLKWEAIGAYQTAESFVRDLLHESIVAPVREKAWRDIVAETARMTMHITPPASAYAHLLKPEATNRKTTLAMWREMFEYGARRVALTPGAFDEIVADLESTRDPHQTNFVAEIARGNEIKIVYADGELRFTKDVA